MNQSSHFTENFILILIITSMFLPTIPIGIDIRLDDIMALFLIPFFLTVKPNFKVNRLVFSYVIILLLFAISTVHGYLFLSVPHSIRDVNEFVRVLKPILIIIAVSYCDSNVLSKKLHALFKWGAVFIFIIGFLEFFNVLGYRKLISIFFTGYRFENLDRFRVILTAGDPNIAAALIMFFVTYILQTMLMTRNKIRNSIILLLLLVVLLMTSSRTNLIVFIVILISSLLYHFNRNRFFSFLVLGLCVVIVLPIIQYFDYIVTGFTTFSDGTNSSMLLRYKQWTEAYNLFSQSPIIGWGAAKSIHTTIVDSEHLLLLRRYGVLGYLAVINFIFGFFVVILLNRKKVKKMNFLARRITLTAFFSLLMIFILMTTNNFFSGYQLMPLFVVMITIAENNLSTIKFR